MNKRRLMKLADLLEADAKNKKGVKFNLCTVVTPSRGLSLDSKEVPVSCGTQACAMGLAAISGAFKRAGLFYRIDAGLKMLFVETTMNGLVTEYDDAAAELFDITVDEAGFLFSPNYYPRRLPKTGARGERIVAKRIRDFVAGKVSP